MSEQATSRVKAQAPPQADYPGRAVKPHEYLLRRDWLPLGDPESGDCLWYAPGFRVEESKATVSEPMTGEVERHEAGKRLLEEGKIAQNPEPRMRVQVVVTPASEPMTTARAYRHQLVLDLRERERAVKAQRAAEQAHTG